MSLSFKNAVDHAYENAVYLQDLMEHNGLFPVDEDSIISEKIAAYAGRLVESAESLAASRDLWAKFEFDPSCFPPKEELIGYLKDDLKRASELLEELQKEDFNPASDNWSVPVDVARKRYSVEIEKGEDLLFIARLLRDAFKQELADCQEPVIVRVGSIRDDGSIEMDPNYKY